MSLLADKVALVTGSGMGIGRAIAEACAREGAKVVVADFNDESGQETVALIEAAVVQPALCTVMLATKRWCLPWWISPSTPTANLI